MDENIKIVKKGLNKLDVFVFAFGAMIGWGWVVLSGEWIKRSGALGSSLAFILGGVVIYFVGQIYAELVSAVPQNSGILVFTKMALGRNCSFVAIWAILLAYFSVMAFEAVALPTVVEYLFPTYKWGYMYEVAGFKVYFTWAMVGIVSSIVIALFNLFGVKTAMFLQTVMTLTVILVGLLFFFGATINGDSSNLQPCFRNGLGGMMSVAIMTPFMYVGFEVIPQAAGEMNIPHKKIGQILVFSVIAAVIWYVGIIIGVARSMSYSQIMESSLVSADAMANVFNNSPFAGKVMIIGGMAGIVTTWNSFYVACSRTIVKLAEEGMIPKHFSSMHPKFGTPWNAIFLICFLTSLAPFLGRTMLVWLSNAGGFGVVVCNILVTISFLVLRRNEPSLPRPYVVKNGLLVGWIALVLSILMVFLYLPGSPAALIGYEWCMVIAWSILGLILMKTGCNPSTCWE